mgnify:CR=1 FL=1
MTNLLELALLGLGTGAIYALAAQGIVLIYRGSGVINFAHGAIALLGAATWLCFVVRVRAALRKIDGASEDELLPYLRS